MGEEKKFERKLKSFLTQQGSWVLKTWSNGVQRSGIPDLLVCFNGFFVAVEIKAQRGRPSELQLWNQQEIRRAGGISLILHPNQFEEFKKLINELSSNPDKHLWEIQTKFDKKEVKK